MILESGSQSVLVVAQELFKNRFDLYDLRVGDGPFVAARATSDIDHALPEFPADRLEFLPVTVGQFFSVGKKEPGFGFLYTQSCFEYGFVPEMKRIPWLATGGTMNIHDGLLSG
jgi:hypothetical protein